MTCIPYIVQICWGGGDSYACAVVTILMLNSAAYTYLHHLSAECFLGIAPRLLMSCERMGIIEDLVGRRACLWKTSFCKLDFIMSGWSLSEGWLVDAEDMEEGTYIAT